MQDQNIKCEKNYDAALALIELYFDVSVGTEEGDVLEHLVIQYEEQHFFAK